jgi:AbrB family looped-hinge helix DNA binding protein
MRQLPDQIARYELFHKAVDKIQKFIYSECMNTIKLQQRGLLTLPKKLRDALSLEEGQVLHVEHIDGKIILEPQQSVLDRQLAADIKQSLADIKNGRFIEFSSTAEFHEKLTRYED